MCAQGWGRVVDLTAQGQGYLMKLNRSFSDLQLQMELVTKPSVSVEFVTNIGIVIPDFSRTGIQMNTNFFHETGLEMQVALKAGQLKFIVPSPTRPVKLLSGR